MKKAIEKRKLEWRKRKNLHKWDGWLPWERVRDEKARYTIHQHYQGDGWFTPKVYAEKYEVRGPGYYDENGTWRALVAVANTLDEAKHLAGQDAPTAQRRASVPGLTKPAESEAMAKKFTVQPLATKKEVE